MLPNLRKAATHDAEVHVLATRYDDQGGAQDYGDLYNLGEWAQWGIQFRRHYVPEKQFLLHNKFILVERQHRRHTPSKQFSLGYGSANLTYSGWLRNLETWEWTTDRGKLGSCRRFLEFLPKLDTGLAQFLQPWLKRLPNERTKSFDWLFTNKDAVRRLAFSQLVRNCRGSPLVLRIVSPYWDRLSPKLLRELINAFGSNQPKHIELWIDGSRLVASAAHYREVLNIVQKSYTGPKLELKAVTFDDTFMKTKAYAPLHAKLIEVEGSGETVARICGSANFTGAAWLGPQTLHGFPRTAGANTPIETSRVKSPQKISRPFSDERSVVRSILPRRPCPSCPEWEAASRPVP